MSDGPSMQQLLKGIAPWAENLTDRALAMCREREDGDPEYRVLFASAVEVGELEMLLKSKRRWVLILTTDGDVLAEWVANGSPG